MSYEVTEQEYRSISGTLGTIEYNNSGRKNRVLDVSVRVGSPKLDNYRRWSARRTPVYPRRPLTYRRQSQRH